MSLFRRRGTAAGPSRAEHRAEVDRVRTHLEEFVRSRIGVEAYVEPPTTVTPPTVLLIASTGEWTRRRVPDRETLRDLGERLHIPVYDVQQTGYPQRMRDWNARVKAESKRLTDPDAPRA